MLLTQSQVDRRFRLRLVYGSVNFCTISHINIILRAVEPCTSMRGETSVVRAGIERGFLSILIGRMADSG